MKAKKIQFDELEKNSLPQANRVIDRKEGSNIKQEISGPEGKPVGVSFTFMPVGPKDCVKVSDIAEEFLKKFGENQKIVYTGGRCGWKGDIPC